MDVMGDPNKVRAEHRSDPSVGVSYHSINAFQIPKIFDLRHGIKAPISGPSLKFYKQSTQWNAKSELSVKLTEIVIDASD